MAESSQLQTNLYNNDSLMVSLKYFLEQRHIRYTARTYAYIKYCIFKGTVSRKSWRDECMGH
jgi:hypothetical protein